MCGIVGILDWERRPRAEELDAPIERMQPRGPDHQGAHADGPVALGHTRLAIIDLSPSSHQPLADSDGVARIVFNGEIYNYRVLRSELQGLGHRFRTQSDTEVVLEAYKAWGEQCVERLNGMFAFALWDLRRETLLLARDRLGEKPLFYARLSQGRFVFASDLWALRRMPEVPKRFNAAAVKQFLALNYLLTDTCILEGIHKLPPGHVLTIGRDGPRNARRYWDLARHFREKRRFASEDAAAEELNALVDDAVRLRMISDVPLGAFLSGGLDSTVIVGAMASVSTPSTFTIDFSEPTFSEAAQARATARFFSTQHHERIVDVDAAAALPSIVGRVSEPFADTSIVPTYFLSRFAREAVTVCLSGDGGDEIFAGYDTYKADRLRHLGRWVPKAAARALLAATRALVRPSFGKVAFDYKLQQFLRGFGMPADEAHFFWRVIFDSAQRAALMRPEHREVDGEAYERFAAHAAEVRDCHYLDRAMYVDIKTWLVDDILVKMDQASMAHSLEVRPPFLDHRLVEFAAGIPVGWKLRGLRGKYLLRRARSAKLPPHASAAKKRGFNAPVSHWLSGRLGEMGRAVTLEGGPLKEWLAPAVVAQLWDEHRQRRADHGFRLFGLTCLGLWMKATA